MVLEIRFENGEQTYTDLNDWMTTVYPVIVHGEAIAPFEIMATIGASVMTSAYLICHWVMEQGYFNVTLDVTEKARLAPKT